MRKSAAVLVACVASVAALSAHITVSPPEAKAGATQTYELRIHNESKVATTAVDVDVPSGIVVTDVATPAEGTVKTVKAGDRITGFTWTVNVAPTTYAAVKFTAKNPAAAGDVHWIMHQHLADGTVVEWSDKPGAKEKAAVTKIAAAPAP